MREKEVKSIKGITLIALVITIIVLLILAGVTIAALSGDNGILQNATKAKEKYEHESAREQIKLAVTESIGENGKIDNEGLKDNLDKIENIGNIPDEITDKSYPIVVEVGDSEFVIDEDGNVGDVIEREGIKIGDYIEYKFDTVEQGYTISSTQSGASNSQTINQNSDIKWRILNIYKDGRVDIIADVPSTSQTFNLAGALGYNNGVYLLNDICKKLYSNKSLNTEARSINMEDIDNLINETAKKVRDESVLDEVQYLKTKKYDIDKTYPELYALEKGSGIDSENVKTQGVDLSENGYNMPTNKTKANAKNQLTMTRTYYVLEGKNEYFYNNEVCELLFKEGNNYWLSSRYAATSTYGHFGIRIINNNELTGDGIINTYGLEEEKAHYIRPIVTLNNNVKIIPCDGGNSSTNMHKISNIE